LRKLTNLIINEYVKVFAKISTVIMLIAIAALAGIYTFANYQSVQQEKRWQTSDTSSQLETYDQIIARERSVQSPGWEIRVERYTYERDHRIDLYDGNWKDLAVANAFDHKSNALAAETESEKARLEQAANDMIATVEKDDWKNYVNLLIRLVNQNPILSAEEKEAQLWTLNYRLTHDVKPGNAYFGYNIYSNDDQADWRNNALVMLESAKQTMNEQYAKAVADRETNALAEAEYAVAINTYRLENEVNLFTTTHTGNQYLGQSGKTPGVNFWTVFSGSANKYIIMFIGVLLIIVAGSAISSEFSSGTVKFLLINPVKRWKILAAKYISVLTMAVIMLAVFYLLNALLTIAFFGVTGLTAPHLSVAGGNVVTGSSFLYVAWQYLLAGVVVVTTATFSFSLSSLVRNSALAIGLGVFLTLSGELVTVLLAESLKADWIRYILFANTDLGGIMNHSTLFVGQTLPFALCVIGVYMAVFLLTAWDGFMRRDVR
jgi:ABC-2 type transport system permease protein